MAFIKSVKKKISYCDTKQWHSQNAEKVMHIKGRPLIKQWFSSIASLIKMGTSLKGKNLLPERANSFL